MKNHTLLDISPSEMNKLVILFGGSYQPWIYKEVAKFGEDARAVALIGLRATSKVKKNFGRLPYRIRNDKERFKQINELARQFVMLNVYKKSR